MKEAQDRSAEFQGVKGPEAVQTWHAQETSSQKDTSVVNLD